MDILCLLLPVLGFFMVSSVSDQKIITAESGQNITLTGRAPNTNKPIIVEWRRADLGNEYVLHYRDEQCDPEEQHPSFKNRVDLQDRQMKDGDVSVILKDVTINDTGTYECHVIYETNSWENICIITLRVVPPPGPGGGTTEDGGSGGLIVGLLVPVVILPAAAVGFLIFRKRKRQSRASSQPPNKEQSFEMGPVYLQVSSESPDPNSVLSVN